MNKAFPSQRQKNNLRNNSTFRIPSFNATLKEKDCIPPWSKTINPSIFRICSKFYKIIQKYMS